MQDTTDLPTDPRANDGAAGAIAYSGPERRQEMHEWRSHVDLRLDEGAQTMAALHINLTENTTATKQVQSDTGELVSLLNSFKGAFVVLDKLGKLARPLSYIAMLGSSIYGIFRMFKGGGGAQ